jgi:hypothetical protein
LRSPGVSIAAALGVFLAGQHAAAVSIPFDVKNFTCEEPNLYARLVNAFWKQMGLTDEVQKRFIAVTTTPLHPKGQPLSYLELKERPEDPLARAQCRTARDVLWHRQQQPGFPPQQALISMEVSDLEWGCFVAAARGELRCRTVSPNARFTSLNDAIQGTTPVPVPRDPRCGDLRLDHSFQDPMTFVPVRDQGEIGSCYANAGATLIDAYRYSKGQRGWASATTLHLLKSASEEETDWKQAGGQVSSVIDAARKFGICVHPRVEEQFSIPEKNDTAVRRLAEIYARLHERNLRGEDLVGQFSQAQRAARTVIACLSAHGFPALFLPPVVEIAYLLQKHTEIEFLAGLARRICDGSGATERVALPELVDKDFLGQGDEAVRKEVDTTLDRSKLPINVSFCSEVLRDPTYRGWVKEIGGWSRCGHHESVLIGRRWEPVRGRCEYLLRNSWGREWGENGNRWIAAEDLFPNVRATAAFR